MATLGNILARGGGVPETPRMVKFQVRTKDKASNTSRVSVEAALLPVTESDRAAALAAAREYCASEAAAPPLAVEETLRILVKALRDPDNLTAQFCMDADIGKLRAGLVREQIEKLASEYTAHLRIEYPEVFTSEDEKKTEDQAEDFSEGGPQS